MRVATGEAVANRIVFKQLLRAGAVDVVQIDATRVGGVNENLAILLLAAKFGIPVCPHAGGVGLCELVQHLAYFDYVAISATMTDRLIEFVDHLHHHFIDPVVLRDGRYIAPDRPGSGAQIHEQSLRRWEYPTGTAGAASPARIQRRSRRHQTAWCRHDRRTVRIPPGRGRRRPADRKGA